MRRFLRITFLYVIPFLLIAVSYEKFAIVRFNRDEAKDLQIKFACYLLGVIVSFLIVPFFNEKDKKTIKQLSDSLINLLASLRTSVCFELQKHFLKSGAKRLTAKDLKLNIRIFVPRSLDFDDIINGSLYFIMKDFEGLYIKELSDLSFKVKPSAGAQGLVGKTFNDKVVRYDFDISNREGKNYNLDEKQTEATSYCNFAIAAPIFAKGSNKIIAIITFDSETKIDTPKNKQ